MILEEDLKLSALKQVAMDMVIAARTAPKGRGMDNLVVKIAERRDIQSIAAKMKEMSETYSAPGFIRDAENILQCQFMLLLGARVRSVGLKKCGMCGFANCDEKNQHPLIPCIFNSSDLGIAIGSAVSLAADRRVDNRIMYTVGQAVLALNLFPPEVKIILAIPLSATSKSPFFDRVP